MSQRNRIVEIAQSQVGYTEGRNNDNKYGKWYGMNNVSWCAIFVSWCANQAGINISVMPRFASCTQMMNWYKSQGRFKDRTYKPMAGDIILYDWDKSGDADHTGIVIATSGNTVYVVEGNASSGVNTSNGDGVCKRSRTIGSSVIRGYCVPQYDEFEDLYPTLRKGSKGERVKHMQYRFNFCNSRLNLGIENIAEDGVYGEKTVNAIKVFQRARNITVDGICGSVTWTALNWQYADTNLDGHVGSDDALMIIQHNVGKVKLNSDQMSVSDMNGDGKVDTADALAIMQRAVGK